MIQWCTYEHHGSVIRWHIHSYDYIQHVYPINVENYPTDIDRDQSD